MVTRQCLEILLHYHYPLTILTKSTLAGRDLDLLASSRDKVEFGVTITTVNEGLRRLIEPRSSPSAERLNLLQEAKRRGIRTYAFLGPLLLCLSDTEANLKSLLRAVKGVGADYFYVDQLNRRFGVWLSLKRVLRERFPDLVEVYHRLLFDQDARKKYSDRLISSVNCLARKQGLNDKMRVCF